MSLDRILDEGAPLPALAGDDDRDPDPERRALQAEVVAALREALDQHLTPRQRQVLHALIVEDVPLDEIVRHWGTNRNAVYKLVHDARLKLRRHLTARGFDVRAIG